MKITSSASSILSLTCFFLLVGCESISNIHVPNLFGQDEVPDEVKDQPRFIEIETPSTNEKDWPRLGDVPYKPKDFSSKQQYDRSMSEMDRERAQAEAAKKEVFGNNSAFGDSAMQNDPGLPLIQPPQFLKK